MTLFRALTGTLLLIAIAGCTTVEQNYISDGQISVAYGDNILEHKEKLEAFNEYEVVQTLHRYVAHRFRKLRVRKSLHTHITINSMRLKTSMFSGGRSHMNVQVKVEENGKALADFSSTETTDHMGSNGVKKLSKGIAKRIYTEVESL